MLAVSAVGTSAVEAAKTEIEVSSGDEVNYILTLGSVPKPVIGCDFSVYYDSSLFEVTSVADFTGSTNESDWEAMINPALDGEVRGNWSILKGVKFDEARTMLTVNFKAKSSGKGHLSYFIRYLYDDSIFDSTDKPQITEYKFTCDVKKNGELVVDKAAPELNVEESQNTGNFVNSVTGDSADADPEIPKTVAKPESISSNSGGSGGSNGGNSGANNNAAGSGNNNNNNNANSGGNSGSGNGAADNDSSAKNNGADNGTTAAPNAAAPMGTDAQGNYVTATDAQGNITATSDTAPVQSSGNSFIIWIIIGLLVVAGGGAAIFLGMKKKGTANAENPDSPEKTEKPDSPDSSEK